MTCLSEIGLVPLSFSGCSCFTQCAKKYQLRHELNLTPAREEESEALSVGRAFHSGAETYQDTGSMEEAFRAIDAITESVPCIGDGVVRVEQEAAKAKAMLEVSARKWPRADGVESELKFVVQVTNPDTGRASRSFEFKGFVDQYHPSTEKVVDFKTASDPAKDMRHRPLSYQMDLYAYGLALIGKPVRSTEFRLVARPSIKFCNKDADAEAYRVRCVEWLLNNEYGLLEFELESSPERRHEALRWLWQVGKSVLHSRSTGSWLRNTNACSAYGRDCEFLPICQMEASGHSPDGVIADMFTERVKLEV